MKINITLALFLLFFLFSYHIACTKADEQRKQEAARDSSSARILDSQQGSEKPRITGISKLSDSAGETPVSAIPVPPSSNVSSPVLTTKETVPSPAVPETAEHDVIRVAFLAPEKGLRDIPEGWELVKNGGTPVLSLQRESKGYSLHMRSDAEGSFGIKRKLEVNVKEYPFLNWKWKVVHLPSGGDVRKSETDDQAIQIYLAFPPMGFPAKLNTPVIGYIWDNEAPRGWKGRSSHVGGGKLRYLVLRNKMDALGTWYTEKRNVYEDYRTLFKDLKEGEPDGKTQGIQLYINSQRTKSLAESYICDIYFSKN